MDETSEYTMDETSEYTTDETSEYTTARAELRRAELHLMQERERVAELRRSLPAGPIVTDYEFDAAEGAVMLSELFTTPARPLVLYHFMFGKAHDQPCPMCAMWTDGWAAIDHHLQQNLDLVMVSSAPMDATQQMAESRGWANLRWVSAERSTFKLDIGGETPDGHLMPFMSVYELDQGRPRLTWSGGAHLVDEHWRGVDLLSPVWHFLDVTKAGRGDWMPSLDE